MTFVVTFLAKISGRISSARGRVLSCHGELTWRRNQSTPIIGGNCHKYHFCREKVCLSRQNLCRDKHVCVCREKNILPRQTYFCRDKKLSRQAYFCRDKIRLVCRDKHVFVATKMVLVAAPASDSGSSRQ